MSTQSQKGFAHAVLIISLVVALAGALGFVFWQNFVNKQPEPVKTNDVSPENESPEPAAKPYKRTTTIPGDWKVYKDKAYPVSFSYPSDWKVTPNSKGNPSQFIYEIGMGSSTQMYDAIIGISAKSLESTLLEFKSGYIANVKADLVAEKRYTIDGNQMSEVVYQEHLGTEEDPSLGPEQHQYFVHYDGNTYTLPVVSKGESSSLTLLESIKIGK